MTQLVLYAAAADSVPVIRCSPPSWAAHITLLEEEVPHVVHWLRFDRGEHRSATMLKLHPAGTVPLLVDGEAVFDDTLGILRHIVDRSPARRLASNDARVAAAENVKNAGMRGFRALMQSVEPHDAWPPLVGALEAWESAHADGRFDVAAVLTVVYATTAASLGLELAAWPRLEAQVALARQRPSLRASWPKTWALPQ